MQKGIDYVGVTISYFCHDGNGNYILNKRGLNCRDEHGTWDNGGGSLEFSIPVVENLKKEIKEEYNADVLEYEFLGYRDVHRVQNKIQTHWVSLDFKVKVDPQQVKNNEPHKFVDVQWFSLGNFPETLHSQLPKALEMYNEKL